MPKKLTENLTDEELKDRIISEGSVLVNTIMDAKERENLSFNLRQLATEMAEGVLKMSFDGDKNSCPYCGK